MHPFQRFGHTLSRTVILSRVSTPDYLLKMSIFHRTSKPGNNEDFPDPNGSLSKEVLSSAIAKANLLTRRLRKDVAKKGVHI